MCGWEGGGNPGELAEVKSLTSKAVPPDHRLLISFMGGWINRDLRFNRAAAKMQVIYFIATFALLFSPSVLSLPHSSLSFSQRETEQWREEKALLGERRMNRTSGVSLGVIGKQRARDGVDRERREGDVWVGWGCSLIGSWERGRERKRGIWTQRG